MKVREKGEHENYVLNLWSTSITTFLVHDQVCYNNSLKKKYFVLQWQTLSSVFIVIRG